MFWTSVKKKHASGKWISGLADLRESAVYTDRFCAATYDVWYRAFIAKMGEDAHRDMKSFVVAQDLYQHIFARLGMPMYPVRARKRVRVQTTLALKPVIDVHCL